MQLLLRRMAELDDRSETPSNYENAQHGPLFQQVVLSRTLLSPLA